MTDTPAQTGERRVYLLQPRSERISAGLVYPEGNSGALRNVLRLLAGQPALCRELGRRGRARVLEHYTQAALARSYEAVYRQMLAEAGGAHQ